MKLQLGGGKMEIFKKKPLDIEEEIKYYLKLKKEADSYHSFARKSLTLIYIVGLMELPKPIDKKDLRRYMKEKFQEVLNSEKLGSLDIGSIAGIISYYESRRKLEPTSTFIEKLETILKKMIEIDAEKIL